MNWEKYLEAERPSLLHKQANSGKDLACENRCK